METINNINYILEKNIEVEVSNGKYAEYDLMCFNGVAIGTLNVDVSYAPREIILHYPKLIDVLDNEELSDYVLKYRGLHNLKKEDIHYGDVMMCYGRVCKNTNNKVYVVTEEGTEEGIHKTRTYVYDSAQEASEHCVSSIASKASEKDLDDENFDPYSSWELEGEDWNYKVRYEKQDVL